MPRKQTKKRSVKARSPVMKFKSQKLAEEADFTKAKAKAYF